MKKTPKFFICKQCGNLSTLIQESGVELTCCDETMTELVPNTTEAATEKHLPVIVVNNNTVTVNVGSVDHPMIPEHFIQWVYIETEKGMQMKHLEPGDAPRAEFLLHGDKLMAAYEYCNLHGLWKTEV